MVAVAKKKDLCPNECGNMKLVSSAMCLACSRIDPERRGRGKSYCNELVDLSNKYLSMSLKP